jgi:hypothetical protein
VKRKLGAPKSTYRHNTQIGKYYLAQKRYIFDPLLSTHAINAASFVKIASNSWQAEVIACSTRYQTL